MELVMFSKMYHSLSVADAGKVIKDMGFDGVDLTVRPEGHVLPENAATELPGALKTLRDMGLSTPMITTSITDASAPFAEDIMATASANGITLLKLGYWNYLGFGNLTAQMDSAKRDLDTLAPLAEKHGVCLCLHTHSGPYLTAMPGLLRELIEDRSPDNFGAYVDLGHMNIEGGLSGWELGLDMLADRIRIVAAKGAGWFYEAGFAGARPKWERKLMPARESAVHWEEAFTYLKQAGFDGPVSVHSEYEGGHSWRVLDVDGITAQTREDVRFYRSVLNSL